MAKLLSDIDLSRSIVVASFLELEAAARSGSCAAILYFCASKLFASEFQSLSYMNSGFP